MVRKRVQINILTHYILPLLILQAMMHSRKLKERQTSLEREIIVPQLFAYFTSFSSNLSTDPDIFVFVTLTIALFDKLILTYFFQLFSVNYHNLAWGKILQKVKSPRSKNVIILFHFVFPFMICYFEPNFVEYVFGNVLFQFSWYCTKGKTAKWLPFFRR